MKIPSEIYKVSVENITKFLKESWLPDILKKLPIIKNEVIIIFHGSIVTGQAIDTSDIDIILLLPAKLKNDNISQLFETKIEYAKQGNIGLELAFCLEDLEEKKVWNNDVLLNIINNEAIVIYDPLKKFKEIQKKHKVFPLHILKEKIIATSLEIIKKKKLLESHKTRKNLLEMMSQREKIIKLVLILLYLKNGEFFNGKHMYNLAKKDTKIIKYIKMIDDILYNIQSDIVDEKIQKLLEKIEIELVKDNLLPNNFFKNGEWRDKKISYGIKTALALL